ncbi:MAG: hypothetical protein JWR19_4582 [Pedosphaera sp.]|nr:hypothetical protein [Pedosphaera sp.]
MDVRVIALLSLFFGGIAQLLLDGQTFTHAVIGIGCGVVAAACGVSSVRSEGSNAAFRSEAIIMGILGLALAVFCVIQVPSAYQRQAKFNARSESQRKLQETAPRLAH